MNCVRRNRLLFAAVSIGVGVLYSSNALAEPAGNETKGKYAYRGVYQECQKRGDVESAKPLLNPDSKTQAQWERVFQDKEFQQFGCTTEWSALTPEALENIEAYLWKHAADSPTPAKCK